jgi:hypothetical protein
MVHDAGAEDDWKAAEKAAHEALQRHEPMVEAAFKMAFEWHAHTGLDIFFVSRDDTRVRDREADLVEASTCGCVCLSSSS